MKFRIIVLFLTSLLMLNCSDSENDTIDNNEAPDEEVVGDRITDDGTTDDGTTDVLITYDKDVAPIISTYCLQCHGDPVANGAPSGAVFNTYEAITSDVAFDWPGFILDRLNGVRGFMPPPPSDPLEQEMIDIVAQWIEDGLLEN